MDRLTDTTRPRPLDPLSFTAVDELNSWNVVRFGARNSFITKRDGRNYEWLFLDTYLDCFLTDPEGERRSSNLYNDINWQPLPWMEARVQTQFPIDDSSAGFRELNTNIRFMPSDRFDFSLGYRQLDGHPVFPDSSNVGLSTYLRLSENWVLGTRHQIEIEDSTLEYQQYSLHHDLGDWVAALGFSVRDNRIAKEYGVLFSLTLKGFTEASMPFGLGTQ